MLYFSALILCTNGISHKPDLSRFSWLGLWLIEKKMENRQAAKVYGGMCRSKSFKMQGIIFNANQIAYGNSYL